MNETKKYQRANSDDEESSDERRSCDAKTKRQLYDQRSCCEMAVDHLILGSKWVEAAWCATMAGSDANAPPPASQLSSASSRQRDDLVKGAYAPGRKTLGLELVADPALMANAEWTGASPGEKKKKKKGGGSKTAKAKPRKRRSPKPQKKQLTEPVNVKSAGDRDEVAQTMPPKATQDRAARSKGGDNAKKGGVRSFFGKSGRKSPPSNSPEDEGNAEDEQVIEVGDEITEEEASQTGVLEAVVDNVSVTHERVERHIADVSGPLASPALVRDSRAQQAQEKRLQRQELNRQFQEVLRSHHERSSFLCASDRAPLAASGPMPGDSAVSDYFCTPTASSSQIHRSGCTPVMGGLGLGNKAAADSLDASVERIASTDSPAGVDELQQQSVKGEGTIAPRKGASWASVSSDKTVVPATNICGMDLDPREIASEFVRSGNWKWMVNSGTKERRLLASGDDDVVQTRKKWKAARKALAAKAAAAEDKASQDVTSFSKPVVEEEWSEKKFEPWDGSADDNFETTFDSKEGVVVQSQQPLADDAWDEKPTAFETTFDSKENVVVKSHHPQINAAWDEEPEARELLEPMGNQPSKAVSSDSVSRLADAGQLNYREKWRGAMSCNPWNTRFASTLERGTQLERIPMTLEVKRTMTHSITYVVWTRKPAWTPTSGHLL
ncbi:hypothetical protein ACHAXT_009133 [Thalassiosira profunda]